MGWISDTWDGIKSGGSEIGSWAEDGYEGAKKIGTKLGRGVGLIDPEDMVDEQGATATAQEQTTQTFQRALEQQQRANSVQGQGAGLFEYASRLPGADMIKADQIGGIMPITAAQADWKQTLPIERTTAATTGPTKNVQLGDVNTNVEAARINGAALGTVALANRATVDPLANDLRGEQLDAARALAEGPSVADKQFRAGMAATAEEQLGLVAQARGADRASARRDAALGLAAKGIQGASLSASAMAQEEIAKKQAFSAALSGMRTQDASVATQQAALDASRNNLNAQLATATSQGNAAAINAIKTKQAELEQSARTATAQLGLNAATSAATVATDTASRQSQIDLANTQARNAIATQNATAANAQAEANAQRQTGTSQFNATATNNAANQNLTAALAAATSNQGANLTASRANQDAGLASQKMRTDGMTNALAAQTNAVNAGTGAVGQQNVAAGTSADIGRTVVGAQTAQQTAQAESDGRLVNFAATVAGGIAGGPAGAAVAGGAMGGTKPGQSGLGDDTLPMGSTSDERAKKNVRKISDDDLLRFGESLKAASFRYKPGFEDGGAERNAGVPSAQELERNPVGKMFVSTDENGVRKVDYGSMGALLTSAMLRRQKAGAR